MNTAIKYQETTWNNIGTQISEDVFPSEAYRLISGKKDNGDLVILDICTPKEFAKAHLENAINLNFFSRAFKSQLNTLDKGKTYFVYCKVGGRSKLAQKQMKKLGFKDVYNIVGGTLLWEEEGLPFASGLEGPSRFALCPVFMSIILVKSIRKLLQSGYRSLFTGGETAGRLENKLNYRLGD
jgi:rhodanese-related sulfurtransferase